MKELRIKEMESGQRMDKYLGKYFKEAPKSFLYKMLRKKNITLNGKKADGSEKLKEGDVLQIFLSEETIEKFSGVRSTGARTRLDIVYEDTHVLLINKPAGMLSQKAKKEDVSLVEYLIGYLLEKKSLTKEDLQTFQPGICNRLDRNTSGLVAAGKTMQGLQALSLGFRDRTFHKYYLTLVKGVVRKPGHIRGYLQKDTEKNLVKISAKEKQDARPIETKYRPLVCSDKGDTLLLVELLTGKTHQIRSHLASIGHPVVGDRKYGDEGTNAYYRKKYQVEDQLLHAWELKFPRLEGCLEQLSQKTVFAPVPQSFERVLKGEGLLKENIREMCENE